jgi:ubiquinone/menaquinone biosynthesis C-methylase UbiE
MKINDKLKRLIYFGHLNKDKVNKYQTIIRDSEWGAIEDFINDNSKFLDVGCGSGYAMTKAIINKGCDAYGIDPEPNSYGVKFNSTTDLKIFQGFAEKIPFPDFTFDVVYSSHVIEHVNSIEKSLQEFERVLKNEGKVIIIVPTAESAWINLISNLLLTSHLRFLRFIARPITKSTRTNFLQVILTYSHGKEDKTVFYDIKNYKVSSWKKIIERRFRIISTFKPFFYPFPDYIQLFKAHKNKKFGSSVAFICEKKY